MSATTMQNDKSTKESDESQSTLLLSIRLMDNSSDHISGMEEKQIKVLPRIHVSHLLKTLSWSFNKSGFYAQDFDAFLVRPEMEIQLDRNRKISEYGLQTQDVVELRRKTLLISLNVNIHQGDVREYQVNASIPVYETVKFLGKKLGVENTKELSLAFPGTTEKNRASITSINWVDPIKSLNAQGVASCDTVLLRKKFFIFNEDIGEAEHNPILRDLLFYQFQNQVPGPDAVAKKKVSQSCSYGIPSETSDLESLSDQEGSLEISFMSEVMKTLERSRNESNSDSVSEEWIQTLSKHKTMNSFFPVKSVTQSEANYLCVKANGVYLTAEAHISDEYLHKWSVEEITSWEKLENGVKIIVDGTAHTFFSDQLHQIVEHLNHLSFLTEKEASGSKQDNTPITRPSLSPALSIPGFSDEDSRETSPEVKGPTEPTEDAGTGIQESPHTSTSGAEASPYHSYPVASPQHSPSVKKEKLTNITPPAYFGLSYKELLDTHMLLHIIVLDQEIREILVDVSQPVRNVIRDICATYGIQYPDDHFLRFPQSTEEILLRYGGKPRLDTLSGEFVEAPSPISKHNVVLDADQPLIEQMHFDIQPAVLLLRRNNFDDVDAVEKFSLDIGSEWPDGEDQGVARYRHFYQCWMSVVQGDREVDKYTAIRMASILTYLYHGSRKSAPFWPPLDFDPKCFLPQKFRNVVGIERTILNFHKKYGDVDLKDAIEEVIKIVEDVPYSNGLHFTVKVPTKSEVLRLKKLEERTLCISKDGILCLASEGKKGKCFKGNYADIRNWATSDASFRLSFVGDKNDFYGYTYQAKQIMEMMQIYVKMTYNEFKMNSGRKAGSFHSIMSDV